MKKTLDEICKAYTLADDVKEKGIYPYYRPISSGQNPLVQMADGSEVLMFGSNSYLGLSDDPRLKEAAIKAIEKYDQLGMFSEGYAAVLKNGKWGYINTKGEEVIPAAINATCVGRFSEGLAFVLGEDYSDFRIINTEGKTVFKGNCDLDCISYAI